MEDSLKSMQPTPNVVQQTAQGNYNEQSPSSNKMMLWLIVGLVLVILVVGGIYFYLNSQQRTALTTTQQGTSVPKAQENLEDDLNSVNIGDLDQDFSAVDKDLQNL